MRISLLLFLPALFAADSDPVLEHARNAAVAYSASLPNFTCDQITTRMVRTPRDRYWKQLDIVAADITYNNKTGESYSNLRVNGKPTSKTMMDLPGSRSEGEFGTILANLFEPNHGPRLFYRKDANERGKHVRLYEFVVTAEESDWTIASPTQSLRVAYKGKVSIDSETGTVSHLERETTALPSDFEFKIVRTWVDYGPVALGSAGTYVLPLRAENSTEERHNTLSIWNKLEFRNYRKYTSDATLKFDDAAEPSTPKSTPQR